MILNHYFTFILLSFYSRLSYRNLLSVTNTFMTSQNVLPHVYNNIIATSYLNAFKNECHIFQGFYVGLFKTMIKGFKVKNRACSRKQIHQMKLHMKREKI